MKLTRIHVSYFICLFLFKMVASTTTTAVTTGNLPQLTTDTSTSSTAATITSTNSTTTTNSTALPALVLSSAYTNSTSYGNITTTFLSSSTFSSINITTPISIPNTTNNPHIYHTNYVDGTVFIICGAAIGGTIGTLVLLWVILSIKAWSTARDEKVRDLESKYQNVSYFGNNSDVSYFDSSSDDDVSEKYLKDTRHSIYSSNLLNDTMDDRVSMFISPMERLANHHDGGVASVFPSSNEHLPTADDRISMFISPTEHLALNRRNSNSTLNLLDNPFYDSAVYLPTSNNDANGRKFRPPSCHLDDLLDNKE
ncbi:hypothetical protein KAFR_0A05170 [Kazachstania africana CBS 2517]|uniref:Mid2 domain-containing protein n=1 Tax=Kazachstania africana (strain ATCC 22294 / BCRC 22015 / CBS 2517 / CECT 1963 / NBRC 1671 / NRRL Y-8276) TaxID=1071382 RepID=H2ANK2_KAZAF|nr:hypothetical protein KAFR_0A05170 [Kazachstania africana CBS 2517]CCF55952.1 hypothetical protein KAFR_0A05170 [Kazachstania africana CBS 2517]